MKNLFLAFALLFAVVVSAQEQFTLNYNTVAYMKEGDTAPKKFTSPSTLVVNYNNQYLIRMVIGDKVYGFKITTSPRKGFLEGKSYEEVELKDADGALYFLRIYTDQRYGTMLFTTDPIMGIHLY